ncbi:DUF1826 domain-containing protein [Rhodophyticola sp. CCM32]|uniref:DUF1826 domain-containing protein n=1 Tax=Rhodophyticola sp. CCM32 TaxID=2916397 RepID=UPI00107F5B55|nr:DUF1826 domain-containing protein [Rhodophyticola sp. CCM32]QBY00481.1 DUF1826 domain-containing protein [Rhodophyticola sp. CCM32]
MSAQSATSLRIARGILDGQTPDILEEIRSPGCAAAIWRRGENPLFQTWIDTVSPARLPRLRLQIAPETVADTVRATCQAQGLPDGQGQRMLANDVAMLATSFARVMQTDQVRLRLDVVTGNACRKFHLDNVPARLLCTYRGRGTEYGLVRPGADPDPVEAMPVRAVGLFRGMLWPGPDHSGVVHRSPPIDGTGETRLLLVIDMPETE